MPLTKIIVLVLIAIYIIVSACSRLEPRVAIAIALALLIASAITLVLGKQDLAEQLAIYTFYLLVAGVVLLFIHHIREDSKGSK